jgi:uncharacterized membrane protein
MPKELVLALLFGVCAAFTAVTMIGVQRRTDERLCRHTIQRTFGKTKAEAEALMVETAAWERE